MSRFDTRIKTFLLRLCRVLITSCALISIFAFISFDTALANWKFRIEKNNPHTNEIIPIAYLAAPHFSFSLRCFDGVPEFLYVFKRTEIEDSIVEVFDVFEPKLKVVADDKQEAAVYVSAKHTFYEDQIVFLTDEKAGEAFQLVKDAKRKLDVSLEIFIPWEQEHATYNGYSISVRGSTSAVKKLERSCALE